MKWIAWVLVIQFILINVCGIFYGYKLTYFYDAPTQRRRSVKANLFSKTWKLFTGPHFQKSLISQLPNCPYTVVPLATQNAVLEAWLLPVDSSKGTVILIHGLGENKSMLLPQAYEFRRLGFTTMLLDLRAHGSSGGHVTTMGYRESDDVRAAYDYVAGNGEKTIALYGVSMGATAITKAIYDYHLSPCCVIMEVPFDSIEGLVAKRGKMLGFPAEPFGIIVTFWASIERGFNGFSQRVSKYVQALKCPVLLQYGGLDRIVSREETNAIFRDIGTPDKRIVRYETADHEFLLNKDSLRWRQEVSNFVMRK